MQKIYLETTVFNFYFDISREANPDTVKLFEEIKSGKYEAYTSRAVIEEIEKAPIDKRDKMLRLIADSEIAVLETSVEAERLADAYTSENVIPLRYRTDGLHIAIASVNDMDMIISLNFQHIVKRKTVIMTGAINSLKGYRSVEIYSPMEVVGDEYE